MFPENKNQDIKNIRIQDYTYILPDDRIALFPPENRDDSRLLIYKSGKITESTFNHIPDQLPQHSLLVTNNTRVIHARMVFYRTSGARIELFCLEPIHPSDYTLSLTSQSTCVWKCIVGNAKKWKGETLLLSVQTPYGTLELKASTVKQLEGLFEVRFEWNLPVSFSEVLHYCGSVPLPPYLNREQTPDDEHRYQTVFASNPGSVAAPTAGLHFTPQLLQQLKDNNIQHAEVTLHVGAGTFKPVKTETLGQHNMHDEMLEVPIETLEKLLDTVTRKQPVIAVGTTSVRTLESIFWAGVKILNNPSDTVNHIPQWAPYEWSYTGIQPSDALRAIINQLHQQNCNTWQSRTQLLIVPGYPFQLTDILITNFHQPENTLILLVAAFVGPDWKNIYSYALDNGFRFLSYGDSSLLFRNPNG